MNNIRYILSIFLFSLFVNTLLIGQIQTNRYRISGKVEAIIGLELVPVTDALVAINGKNIMSITDSIGNYTLDSLQSGNYHITARGMGYSSIDTTIKVVDKSITNVNLLIITNCSVNKLIAERDIKDCKPRLLLSGGISPVVYVDQHLFEKKYNIIYDDFGCIIDAYECMNQYNRTIFQYLDNNFGKAWRKEVRKDVIGFNKWK